MNQPKENSGHRNVLDVLAHFTWLLYQFKVDISKINGTSIPQIIQFVERRQKPKTNLKLR